MTEDRANKRQRAVDLYRTTQKSTEDIAEDLGVSRSTLYNWLNQAGLSGTRRHGGGAMTDSARLADELEEFRTALAGRTLTQTEIADRWQAAVNTLNESYEVITKLAGEQESRWQGWHAAYEAIQRDVRENRETTVREVGELRRDVDQMKQLLAGLGTVVGRVQGVLETMVGMQRRPLDDE